MLPFPPRHIPPLGPGKTPPRQRVFAQWRGVDLAHLASPDRALLRLVECCGACRGKGYHRTCEVQRPDGCPRQERPRDEQDRRANAEHRQR